MAETRIQIDRQTVLVVDPAHPAAGPAMTQDRALALLRRVQDDPIVMHRLRLLVPNSLQPSRRTDHQVLTWIAGEIVRGAMILEVGQSQTAATSPVKFADLARNYPTNQSYSTDPRQDPNIWKYIGGRVYLNGTTPNPASRTVPPAMIFSNSCAIRMSRALNYSGATIQHTDSTSSGGDGKWYLFRVADLEPKMNALFGAGRTLTLSNWRNEIAGKTGVVKFSATWSDATGHFTLWDGNQMINGPFDEADARASVVNGVKFWEVK